MIQRNKIFIHVYWITPILNYFLAASLIDKDPIKTILFSGSLAITLLIFVIFLFLNFIFFNLPKKMTKPIFKYTYYSILSALLLYFYFFKYRNSASKLDYDLDNFFVGNPEIYKSIPNYPKEFVVKEEDQNVCSW